MGKISDKIEKLEKEKEEVEEKVYKIECEIDKLQDILDNPPRIMDMTNGDEINCPDWIETEDEAREWCEEKQEEGKFYEVMENN